MKKSELKKLIAEVVSEAHTKTAAERIESLRIEGWVAAFGATCFVSKDGTEVAVVLPDGHVK